MLGLKFSTQVVTQGYRRFHTKIDKKYTAFTNSSPENKQTNKKQQQRQQRRTQSTYQTKDKNGDGREGIFRLWSVYGKLFLEVVIKRKNTSGDVRKF